MADPRAFISFDFDHNEGQRKYFVGQSVNSRTPFNIQDWSSKEELENAKWQEIIAAKVNRCHLMIVLVGKSMSTAKGVEKEISMAIEKNVPVFGVYVDGANSSSDLPKGLSRNRVVPWEWDKIASSIETCMKEGKNK